MYALRHQFSHLLSQVSSLLSPLILSVLSSAVSDILSLLYLLDTCCVYHTHLANPMWVQTHTPMLFITFNMEDPYKGFLHGPVVIMVQLILNPTFKKLMVFNRHIDTSSYLQAPPGRLTDQHVVAMLHCMVLNLSHMNWLHMLQHWWVCQCHVCLCSHNSTDTICTFWWGNVWPWWPQ